MSLLAPTKSILISGGSIAGPALAWWLTRYGFKTTVVERWHELRPGGQGIDITGEGREIARRMSLESAILDANTGERGSILTDVAGVPRVWMPLEKGGFSPTNETEILRGSFARILYDATKDRTDWRFGDQIGKMVERDEGVDVQFQSGREETYDLVVLADGVGSRTRKLAFPPEDIEFKNLGIYIAYFTIPVEETDTNVDQWMITHLPGRRCLSFRPGGDGTLQAFLMWVSPDSAGYEKLPQAEQIAAIRKHLLSGSTSTSPVIQRALRGLDSLKALYLEYSGQVKAKTLVSPGGRISMIGDAAYCGTPVSGAGTTLSLVGAYVLAGELAKHLSLSPEMFPGPALEAYETFMKPFAEGCQELPPGIPHIALPESEWGIKVLHQVLRTAVWGAKTRVAVWARERWWKDEETVALLPDYREYEVGKSA